MGRWVDGYVGGWKDEKAYPLFFSSDWLSSVRKSTSSVTFLWRVGGWVGGWIWVGGWVGGTYSEFLEACLEVLPLVFQSGGKEDGVLLGPGGWVG